MMRNMQWYHNLNKPPFNPPDWVFAPVWTVLYITIVISLFLFLKGGWSKEKTLPLVFFILQMLFNFAWTLTFFGMQNINLAFVVISLMIIFLILTIVSFYKFSKPAAMLLVPYLLWVVFAAYLNFMYMIRN